MQRSFSIPRRGLRFGRIVIVGLFASVAMSVGANAQTAGQSAAQAVRNAVIQNKLAERGIDLPPVNFRQYSQSNYRSRRPIQNYGLGYGYPGGYGYTPYRYGGYGYGYGNYGYRPYGYGYPYQPSIYRFPRSGTGGSTLGNRANTPGSHYFGPPHASQSFGN